MKRTGGLYAWICDLDNLRLAYCKARRGKRERPDVLAFECHLENNLQGMHRELLAGAYQPGAYRTFTIYEPKERLISVAPFRDRVLHHAIINVCEPVFERQQIQHSFACRRGRGTYAALDQAIYYAKRNDWFLKLDMRKYFQSISHPRLKAALRRIFREPALLSLFDCLIDSQSGEVGYGLPIGNLTSQFLANHYLALADHFVKEQLCRQAYLRYMDDLVLWGDSAERMLMLANRMERFLSRELELRLNPWLLNRVEAGLPLLGHLVYREKVSLLGVAKRRYRAKLAEAYQRLASGEWCQAVFAQHAQALVAVTEYAGETEYRKEVLRLLQKKGIIPQEGVERVLRGGSWNNNARNCRSANRNRNQPDNRNNNNGLRVGCSAPPAQESGRSTPC